MVKRGKEWRQQLKEVVNKETNRMQNRSYKIKNSSLSVIFGNILESDTDVIVSSDDTDISMGGGVSRAILTHGGSIIQQDAQKKLPTQAGEVVVSTAGNLKNKFVFHCISVNWYDREKRGFDSDEELKKFIVTHEELTKYIITHSVEKCFQLLHALDCDSIAMPVIGSGAASLPFVQVAELMAEVIAGNLQNTNKPLRVEIYILDHLKKFRQDDFISLFESFASKAAIARYKAIKDGPVDDGTTIGKPNPPAPVIGEHEIFISYSRKDKAKADVICDILKAHSIKYWIDKEGIYSGSDFKGMIVDAIDDSKAVLFLSSEHSNSSKYVVSEIEYAISISKPIVPIMLDDSLFAKALRLDLANIDQIDYRKNVDGGKKLLTSLAYIMQIKEENNSNNK